MELVEAGDFLRWAADGGIVPDPRGPDGQAPLTFGGAPPAMRRWVAPEAPFNLPGFASCLLGSTARQSSVYLFIKGGAPWFTGSDPATGPEWEHLRDRVVATLPIPRDFRGALKMAFSESDDVVLLLVTFFVYAWWSAGPSNRVSIDDIAPRYLGRGFTAEEGVPPAAVDEAQRRLGVRIPASLAYYYQRAGGCTALNGLHHRLYAPSELLIDGGYLVFMDENQTVVSWGFRTSDCGEDDPTVWQRNNTPPHEWYSEDKPFTRFLTGMFDWYVEMGMLRR